MFCASRLATAMTLIIGTLAAGHAGSTINYTTYDLAVQFPFQPFVLVQGTTPLPIVTDWGGYQFGNQYIPQPAYAPETSIGSPHPGDFLPAWFRMTAPFRGQYKGDIIVHTTDTANGQNNGPASALFVSPMSGRANISGLVYAAGFATPNRPQAWQVSVDGKILASGSDPDDGSINRSHPTTFNVIKVPVKQGSVVALTVVRAGFYGTYMGVDLRVVLY